ncbi:hypothetical protein FACS1894211_12700 [Clostridia bacterium]|nr:hypothetical protein FACS1894211_12700 [Clostridia bacterium]
MRIVIKILLCFSLVITAPIAAISWLVNAIIYILFRWIPIIGKYISTPFQTISILIETPFILTAYKLGWTSPKRAVSDRLYNTNKLQTYKAMMDSGEPELIKYAEEGLLEMAKTGDVKACKELLRIKR